MWEGFIPLHSNSTQSCAGNNYLLMIEQLIWEKPYLD